MVGGSTDIQWERRYLGEGCGVGRRILWAWGGGSEGVVGRSPLLGCGERRVLRDVEWDWGGGYIPTTSMSALAMHLVVALSTSLVM